MTKTVKFIGIIALQICSSLVFAGGPLVLEGPYGNTPATYLNPNITVHVETGDLSATVDNAAANAILQEAFSLWNDINTSTVNLIIDETLITDDINIGNFGDFIPKSNDDIPNTDNGLNPIIYDSNGEIIDAFFYAGASEDIIGFAASAINIGSSFFNEGYAVINGKDLGLTDTTFKLLIAHEIGHFFGLDHSQANINNQETDFGIPGVCLTSARENYPLMYPFICRNIENLHTDDVSAVSALYPAANLNDNFGVIEGRFVDESGNAVLGANIWAENTTTGETVSIVSDYLKQGTGFYQLYLPPGNYTLHANSINTLFNGGSSVGPYASSIFDASFQSPHPITTVTYQGKTQDSDEVITISSSQTLTINFSIAGNYVVLSDGGSSSNHIFGATSFVTLLFLFGLLITARRLDNTLRW